MKIETKLRNEFLFEVRDAKTGELKQTVKSHNIVLNRFFDKRGNEPETYTTDILRRLYVGDGVGTLDPTRTTLFNQVATYAIDNKTITEKDNYIEIKGSVTLGTNTLVGIEISEVGISKVVGSPMTSYNYLVTHSLLKDMNGNPITILKSDTDIVTIYATIFVYFDVISGLYDTIFPRGGLSRLLLMSIDSIYDSISSGDFDSIYNKKLTYVQKGVQNDININRKVSVSARIGPDEDTKGVTFLLTNGIGISSRHESFDDYRTVTLETLGIGDGSNSIFRPKIDTFENIDVFIDGVPTSDYSILGRENSPLEWFVLRNGDKPIKDISTSLYGINSSTNAQGGSDRERTYIFTGMDYSSASLKRIRVNISFPHQIFRSITFTNKSGDSLIIPGSELSTDGWIPIPEGYELIDSITFARGLGGGSSWVSDYELNQEYGIQFNTPPPEGAVITATYTTPRIPITPDNVLDIEITRTYNEYSG